MSSPFKPSTIYIDEAVQNLSHTEAILAHFPNTPTHILQDPKILKKPSEMTWAKKGLLLTRLKSDQPLRYFEANAKSIGRPYYSFGPISNCHLECTYCILQSYLANNPLITIYTNIEEILEKLTRQLQTIAEGSVISTGLIADSLALDSITEFNPIWIPFFARQKKFFLELKTKSDQVTPFLNLEHGGQTILSWSMNPQNIVAQEEHKTANVKERLKAAQQCVAAGYRVGFHFDPMIVHPGWEENYRNLIDQILGQVPTQRIAWMSLGTLRFPKRQATIMKKRFPRSQQIHEPLQHTHLPFLTYPKELRTRMIQELQSHIKKRASDIYLYGCMETDIDFKRGDYGVAA